MRSRILVTGAGGFVGGHVVRELRSLGYDVLASTRQDLDLLDVSPSELEISLFSSGVDAIVHLASLCGGIGINKDNPGRFIYENLQMGINLIEAARLANVSKVVNLSTVCSYPKFANVPFKEEEIWNGYPEETNAPYGIAKKTIVEMGRAYSQQYGMDITNLVPVNMYGEGDNFDEYSSHVIPALIRKFESPHFRTRWDNRGEILRDTLDDPEPYVELWGTGSASREFMHASDCARAIAISLEKRTGSEPINLGTGQEITIRDLAELIKRVGHYRSEIVWDDTKPDGQPRRCLDVSRADRVLRWRASVKLEEGLERTIKWYRQTL